jgi:C-terminal processing protease CtpA/Prc
MKTPSRPRVPRAAYRLLSVLLLPLCALAGTNLHAQSARHSGLIDAEQRDFLVEQVLAKIREFYVSSDTAMKIEAAIRAHHAGLDYEHHVSAMQFAEALTRDLQAASGDKHLVVDFSEEPISPSTRSSPPDTPVPWPASAVVAASERNTWHRRNCMFVNVATLVGNVGYVKFDAFLWPDVCGETAAAAMNLVADCNTLIVDLRDNVGGDPAMVAFIASYLFSRPVHLNSLYEPRTNATVQSWTLPVVPGRRFTGQSVFVLISPRTFSAAEEFAYDLQMLKRATIVGEASAGGAHAALPLRLDAHFRVAVPFARSVNPLSRTNWEGRGVEPDVLIREDFAMQAAWRMSLQKLIPQIADVTERQVVESALEVLTDVLESRR